VIKIMMETLMNVNFITVLKPKKINGEMITAQLISQICVVMSTQMNVIPQIVVISIVLEPWSISKISGACSTLMVITLSTTKI
jgi:hypothetical protein